MDLDDELIVDSVLRGEKEAFRHLIEKYQKPIFNLMLRLGLSREDAADQTQETFIKAYRHLETFQRGRKFFAWLYTIGLNQARDMARKKKLDCLPLEEGMDASPGDPPGRQEELLLAKIDQPRLIRALQLLPLEYREAVILHYHHDLSMAEVAAVLGLGLSGAKMRVRRGVEKLRFLLGAGSNGNKR